jgi:heat shock protein HslJ
MGIPRRWLILALALVAAVLFSGCGSSATGGSGGSATTGPHAVDGHTFISQSVTVDGRPQALVGGEKSIRLRFESGRFSASASCNILGATYRLDGGVLRVDEVSSTAMGCDPPGIAEDGWLAGVLQSGPTVVRDRDTLILASGTTEIRFLDRQVAEPDVSLTGRTWTVDGLIEGAGVSSVPVGVTAPTVTFTADGQVQVDSGCNRAQGTAKVGSEAIEIHLTSRTEAPCSVDGARVERIAFTTLEGTVGYRVEASTLHLTNGDVGLGLRS